MLSKESYVQQSLEFNLFFMRIAKEHAFFMEGAFLSPRDQMLIEQAEALKIEFTNLLQEALGLANGIISPEVLASGELVTKHTLDAERVSHFYSGIELNSELTHFELSLQTSRVPVTPTLVDQVCALNERAIQAATILANFKGKLLQDMISCKVFTFNYHLLIDHILREAQFYLKMLHGLQNRQVADIKRDIIAQEIFWNRIMAEHSKFIRGLLDPTEVQLFNTAHNFGQEFDQLTAKAMTMTEQTTILPELSRETYNATVRIREFKTAGTEGLIDCKIKAAAMPLLGDHVVREANHYLRLLGTFLSRLR
ncbi:MAG: DUF2935 domain-containing protein [Desulfitobacterium sp.]